MYKDQCVGDFSADIVVEGSLIVELKCAGRPAGEHLAQCLNDLRASGKTLCLLINFRKPTLEWRRVVRNF